MALRTCETCGEPIVFNRRKKGSLARARTEHLAKCSPPPLGIQGTVHQHVFGLNNPDGPNRCAVLGCKVTR